MQNDTETSYFLNFGPVEISGGNKILSRDMQIFLRKYGFFADFGLFELEISEVLPAEISAKRSGLS